MIRDNMTLKKFTLSSFLFFFFICLAFSVLGAYHDINIASSANYVLAGYTFDSGNATSSTNYEVSPLTVSDKGTASGQLALTDTNGDVNSDNYYFTPGFVGAFLASDENIDLNFMAIWGTPGAGETIGCGTTFSVTWDFNGDTTRLGGFYFWVDDGSKTLLSSTTRSTGTSISTAGSHTLYLKAVANNLNIGKIYSRNVTIGSCTGSGVSVTTPVSGSGPSGGGTPPGAADDEDEEEPAEVVSEETVFEDEVPAEELTEEAITSAIQGLEEFNAEAISAAVDLISDVRIDRSIASKRQVLSDDTEKYVSTVSLEVSNVSGGNLTNIHIVEVVPKTVAENASEISSDYMFSVLEEDPVLQFVIDELDADASATITYAVDKQLDEESVADWTAGFATSVEEVVGLCVGVTCAQEACKRVSCNSATGGCTAKVNRADGTSCGDEMVCQAGECVAVPPVVEPEEAAPLDPTLLGGIVIVLVILGLVYFFVLNKPKKKGLAKV